MAKLKAHGREVARVVIPGRSDDEYFINRKNHYAFMSDRWILSRMTARHRPDRYYPTGKSQDWGWKRYTRIKEGVNISDFARRFAEKRDGEFKLT